MSNFQPGLIFQLFLIHMGLALAIGPSILWCVIWVGYAFYITYLRCIDPIKDVTKQTSKFISETVEEMTESIGESINSSVKSVADNLKDTGNDLSKGAFAHISTNLKNHMVGISLCVNDVTKASSVSTVVTETGKIMSMIGLEQSLVTKIVGTLSGITAEGLQHIALEHQVGVDFEKALPLLSSAMAVGGVEIGKQFDINIKMERFMDRTAKNIKASEIIISNIRKACEVAGLTHPANYSLLQEINAEVVTLKTDFEWIAQTLVINGSDFLRPENDLRVSTFKRKRDDLSNRLRAINLPELKNNQITNEINKILYKSNDYLNQIELIKRTNGIRPVPVGVCFVGPSGIGKSTLIDEFIQRVKRRLKNTGGAHFYNADQFSTWNMQQRDEFDTGYVGQDITYEDDAFQSKENTDHLMYFQYISPTCVGTLQGAVDQKGSPFRAIMCVTTCNELPITSVTVNYMQALWNRFPHTSRVTRTKPTALDYDRDFKHLKFETGSMTDHREGNNEGIDEVTLNQIVERVCDNIIFNRKQFEQKLATLNDYNIQQQSQCDDDSDEDEFDSDEEAMIDVALGHGNEQVDIEIDSESEQEDDPQILLERVTNMGSYLRWAEERNQPYEGGLNHIFKKKQPFNGALANFEFTRHLVPAQVSFDLAREAVEDLARMCTEAEGTHNCGDLGDWTEYLIDAECKSFDAHNYTSLYEFLIALGRWRIKLGKEREFEEKFLLQNTLKCQSDHGDFYLWGPILGSGSVLLLVGDETTVRLHQSLLPKWRQRLIKCKRRMFELYSPAHWRRLGLTTAIHIAGASLFPHSAFMAIVSEMAYWETARQLQPRRHVDPVIGVLDVRYRMLEMMAAPATIMNKAFAYLERVSAILLDSMTGLALRALESIGVDVSEYWREIAQAALPFALSITTICIASILVYIMWKIIQFFITPKVEQEGSVDSEEPTQKQREAKNAKIREQRQLKVRELRHQVADEEEVDIEVDGLIHHTLALKDSFKNPAWLSWVAKVDKGVSLDTRLYNQIEGKTEFVHQDIIGESRDFMVERNRVISLTRQKRHDGRKEQQVLNCQIDLSGTLAECEDEYQRVIEYLSPFAVSHWLADVRVRRLEDEHHMYKINMTGLNTFMQGQKCNFVRNSLKNLNALAKTINGETIQDNSELNFQNESSSDSIDLRKSLKHNHQVLVSKVPIAEIDTSDRGIRCYGIGSNNVIITPAHGFERGEIFRFWRYEQDNNQVFQLAIVETRDLVRDVAISRILNKDGARALFQQRNAKFPSRMASVTEHFRDVSKHLYSSEEIKTLYPNFRVVIFLPTQDAYFYAMGSFKGKKNFMVNGSYQVLDQVECNAIETNHKDSQKGDCGGTIVTSHDRYQAKLIGFHTAGLRNYTLGAYLVKEDLIKIEHQCSTVEDKFATLIVEGEPTDLPQGSEVKFIGKLRKETKPAGAASLAHWHLSPFEEQFEEQLQPAPLHPEDPRIKIELPRNLNGKKSLLLRANQHLAKKIPDMDEDLVEKLARQMMEEMSVKIGHINTCSSDSEQLLFEGLNGHRENRFCKGMELNKASGLPWNLLPKMSKKSDFLSNDNGTVYFNDGPGKSLKKRVLQKVEAGKQGERIISFSNSKLKDAVIKNEAVKAGKTRVFHSIPVEKIITDSCVYGHFKEAYTSAYTKLNHAIGTDPHSIAWRKILDHIEQHPNIFDLDFAEYDKYLQQILLKWVFWIIREVIKRVAPDDYYKLREVLSEESIKTFVVDFDTIFETTRGNKSGEYLTTVANCIANDLLSFYAFAKCTDVEDIQEFRENVANIEFGDDKLESVSTKYAAKYNYFTVKKVMESIGHTITPGAKDGVEREFCSRNEMIFLKRNFVEMDGKIVAPLLKRSIEGPFVWTRIADYEIDIWRNLVDASMYEAYLHGEEYFESFRDKLSKCTNQSIREAISCIIAVPFNQFGQKYNKRFYGENKGEIYEDPLLYGNE